MKGQEDGMGDENERNHRVARGVLRRYDTVVRQPQMAAWVYERSLWAHIEAKGTKPVIMLLSDGYQVLLAFFARYKIISTESQRRIGGYPNQSVFQHGVKHCLTKVAPIMYR